MRIATLAAVAAMTASLAFADIAHKTPSAQEKAAIEKALAAMTNVIDRFANENWTAGSDSVPEYDTINGEPAGPLDAGLDFNRKFSVKEGSPLFRSKVEPQRAALQKAIDAKDFAAMQTLGAAINGTLDFTVETDVNVPVVPAGDGVSRIEAKGAALAISDKSASDDWNVYVAAGDWAHAVADGDALRYKFRNRPNTPHVENIVFRFRTRKDSGPAADRIREILRTTDWSSLNAGLTP